MRLLLEKYYGIMKYAGESDAKEFIIGTENSIVQHLQYECRTRNLSAVGFAVCHNMKLTTLMDVYSIASAVRAEKRSSWMRM